MKFFKSSLFAWILSFALLLGVPYAVDKITYVTSLAEAGFEQKHVIYVKDLHIDSTTLGFNANATKVKLCFVYKLGKLSVVTLSNNDKFFANKWNSMVTTSYGLAQGFKNSENLSYIDGIYGVDVGFDNASAQYKSAYNYFVLCYVNSAVANVKMKINIGGETVTPEYVKDLKDGTIMFVAEYDPVNINYARPQLTIDDFILTQ